MERAIVEALKSAYGNRNIKFQVVIQNRQLDIYFNHRRDDRPNYLLLEETVAAAIASLDLAAIDGIRLYCRPQGQVTPDWQTSIEFQQTVNTDDIETIGTTESQIIADNLTTIELSSASTTENYPIYPIASDPNAITDLEVQTEWERNLAPENDSTSFDTGLLHHAGLTHSSSLEETEIDNVFDAIESEVSVSETEPHNELARYCFVSNRQLLTSDTIDPGKEIVRLIKFFHHLSDRTQLRLLPILTTYFQQGTISDFKFSSAVQKWFKQIQELNYDDQQTLAIWLSRYCFNPDATLEEFKAINARQAEEVKVKKAYDRQQAYTYTPVKAQSQPAQLSHAPFKTSKRFSFKELLLPTAWILATVILLAVAIADRSPNSTTTVEANFGNYALPLNFGLHTIFAAIGIAIASWLNLGIKINRPATIYLAALVLGIMQLLAAVVPVFDSLTRVILPILAILALNQSLKGFQISNKHGVAAIAIGILTIILVQLSLYGLFLGSIGSLL